MQSVDGVVMIVYEVNGLSRTVASFRHSRLISCDEPDESSVTESEIVGRIEIGVIASLNPMSAWQPSIDVFPTKLSAWQGSHCVNQQKACIRFLIACEKVTNVHSMG